jgi:hypothetical protein
MNRFQPVFDTQQAYFTTDATKSYAWRRDQLHCRGPFTARPVSRSVAVTKLLSG